MLSRACVTAMTSLAIAGLSAVAAASGLLRLEEFAVPARVPAGVACPVVAGFTVVEPVRDGWRVSAELAPVAGGASYSVGPEQSLFNATTPVATERTVRFEVPIPESAPLGRYRVILDHYDNPRGEWVHLRYTDRAGQPIGVILGETEVVAPLAPLPLPAPQRKLRPGEVHRVFECEDFRGMDGRGEDLGLTSGWTWYSWHNYSRTRAAINNTGRGSIYATVDPPLPPGDYKVFARMASTFSTIRVSLGEVACEAETLRADWNEIGTVHVARPVTRLTLAALRKIGEYVIVDSVYVTNNLDTVATHGWDPSRQFLPADARPTKTARTIYTPEYLRALQARLRRYPQLRKTADEIIAEGQRLATYDDERLFQVLADTRLKREYYVNQLKGCPTCGLKVLEFGAHPWIIDPLDQPFKMQCPVCKQVFPSNDFAAGELTGGDYPDDGTGYKRREDTYHFIGEYVHWAYRNHYLAYLTSLTQAIVLTEDPKLAHKLAVLLLRAAQQYPNSEDRRTRAFKNDWATDCGCITDTVWSSYEGRNYGQAYDAVWPYLDRDSELLQFARQRIPEIQTAEDLRLYIEENLLRRVGQAYCDNVIQGNPGYHHKGMAWLLLALGDLDSTRYPNCQDLLECLYYRVYGPMRYFGNLLGPDGSSFESPGYNAARLNMLEAMDVVDRFFAAHPDMARDRFPSLWDDPRFAAQFDYYTDYILLDRWEPAIGDAGGETVVPERRPANRLSVVSPGVALAAWQRYRTPRLARLAYGYENRAPAPSLWDELPLKELAAARRRAPDAIERRTQALDDYGLALLRSGEGDDARVLWLWYGRLLDHGHEDGLSIGFAARGLDLLPELGYPKSWTHAARWEAHSLVHNTLTVDGSALPTGRERGRLTLLSALPGFQVVEASAGSPGGEPPQARRLLALVDIDAANCYAVDICTARGGSSHTLSYHGPQGRIQVSGVALARQPRGTLAGEDVAYGQPVRSADGAEIHTPLAHMTEVERGEPTAPFTVDYALGDELDTHLRLHHFPSPGTNLGLGTGRPPSNPEAYAIRFCLQTREGTAPLAGRYLTVLEPYAGQPCLKAVERLKTGEPARQEALRVARSHGDDLVFLGDDAEARFAADGLTFTGRAGLVRRQGSGPTLVVATAFTRLNAPGLRVRADAPYLTGEITACDYARRTILVDGLPADRRLVGQAVRVGNALHSTMQRIVGVQPMKSGAELMLAVTALRHEGVVAGLGESALRDGAPSPWAFDGYLRGTRLVNEAGDAAWTVAGASGGWWSAPTGTALNLVPEGPRTEAGALREALSDADGDGQAEFRLYDYGVGDRLEVASWACLRRAPDGRWRGDTSPGVTYYATR